MLKSATVAAVLSALAFAATPALAHDFDGHIRRDWEQVQRDKAQVRTDEARLQHEQRDAAQARYRAHAAWERGNIAEAHRQWERVRHETADVRAAERTLDHDRAQLQADRRDLRQDIGRR